LMLWSAFMFLGLKPVGFPPPLPLLCLVVFIFRGWSQSSSKNRP
jgi:hypothetical protein